MALVLHARHMSEHGMATKTGMTGVMFSGMDVCAAGARVRQESSVCVGYPGVSMGSE